jgi:DNA-binding response OmpR family regulator
MSSDISARQRRLLIVGAVNHAERALADCIEGQKRFKVERLVTIASCIARLDTAGPAVDVVLMSHVVCGESGVDACLHLRNLGIILPIMMMTGQEGLESAESEAITIRALDAGANDVIHAPFRPAEVLARIRAHLRAFETGDDAVLMVGPLHFRPARRQLENMQTGAQIHLTEKEVALLKVLHRADGTVSRAELLAEVWGHSSASTTHTLETHIYRVRRKIERAMGSSKLLIRETGGYRLNRPTQIRRETALYEVPPALAVA